MEPASNLKSLPLHPGLRNERKLASKMRTLITFFLPLFIPIRNSNWDITPPPRDQSHSYKTELKMTIVGQPQLD
jgi:hypothetical protein